MESATKTMSSGRNGGGPCSPKNRVLIGKELSDKARFSNRIELKQPNKGHFSANTTSFSPRSQALAWKRESPKLCFDALQTLADHHVGSNGSTRVNVRRWTAFSKNGIPLMPFLYGSWGHLLGNTIPLCLVLFTLIASGFAERRVRSPVDERFALRKKRLGVLVDDPLNEFLRMAAFLEFHDQVGNRSRFAWSPITR